MLKYKKCDLAKHNFYNCKIEIKFIELIERYDSINFFQEQDWYCFLFESES